MTYVNGVRATPDEPFPLLSKAMEPQSRNGNTRDERINKPKKKNSFGAASAEDFDELSRFPRRKRRRG